MLHFFLACTCVHARSWNVCWPCSQDSLGESGSHLTVMICDGFPMVSRSIQQTEHLHGTRSFIQNDTRLHTIVISCLLHLIIHVYTVIICHHSLPAWCEFSYCASALAWLRARPLSPLTLTCTGLTMSDVSLDYCFSSWIVFGCILTCTKHCWTRRPIDS